MTLASSQKKILGKGHYGWNVCGKWLFLRWYETHVRTTWTIINDNWGPTSILNFDARVTFWVVLCSCKGIKNISLLNGTSRVWKLKTKKSIYPNKNSACPLFSHWHHTIPSVLQLTQVIWAYVLLLSGDSQKVLSLFRVHNLFTRAQSSHTHRLFRVEVAP